MNLSQEQKAAALEALAEKNGDIDADRVWKAARRDGHELHDYFIWDVKKAAIEHWRYTARKIIASCHIDVTYKQVTFEIPKYVRDPEMPSLQQGYCLTQRIADEKEYARLALETELSRAEHTLTRAISLARAFDMVEAIQPLLDDIGRLLNRLRSEEEVEPVG